MSVYKVQVENQARPVCVRFHENAAPRTACVVKVDGVECVGQVLGPRPSACPACHISPLVRLASLEDTEKRERHRKLETDALAGFRAEVRALKLPMHPVSVQVALDESKFFFVYTAENKVDFRELVRILAQRFHSRIEMRQVGVRDESRLLGGFGHCGQPLCCTRYLRSFQPVTVRMAKDQGLSLNPAKISGHCGRLMCCLRYEAPAKGTKEPAKGPEEPAKGPVEEKETAPPAGE